VRIELHPEYADALQNSRRREIARLEADLGLRIEVIAAPALHRAEQNVEWLAAPAAAEAPRGREAEPSVRAWQAGGGPKVAEPAGGRGRGQGPGRGRGQAPGQTQGKGAGKPRPRRRRGRGAGKGPAKTGTEGSEG
jgi:hypothetical protein